MAQKFGNSRWVRDGFLDNRTPGMVVGVVHFAAIGPIELCLRGDFKGEIAGQMICLRNSRFEDDDLAGHVIGDMEPVQMGTVNLISFDPHPNLPPHPYIEWFSERDQHYRIELNVGDAWVADAEEAARWNLQSTSLLARYAAREKPRAPVRQESDSDWV